jgi:hypothetical protein
MQTKTKQTKLEESYVFERQKQRIITVKVDLQYCRVQECDSRRGLDWQLFLLNTPKSQLQATIALSIIHTLSISLQHVLSLLSLLSLVDSW